MADFMVVSCSKCGEVLANPTRKLENSFFSVAVYECKKCQTTNKEALYHYQNSVLC